jgi:hypothetical protein
VPQETLAGDGGKIVLRVVKKQPQPGKTARFLAGAKKVPCLFFRNFKPSLKKE